MTCISLFFSSYILIYSEPEWTDVLKNVEVDEFMEVVGPTTPLPPDTSVLSLFQMFFTTALMGSIVEQTNAYALLVLGENPRWTDVNDTDIWAFLGFCILMGINQLPALHHYWSADPLFHYHPIAERISRDRFLSIWRFLHFVDNQRSALPQGTYGGSISSQGTHGGYLSSTPPDPHCLWKIRPVISAVVAACCTLYRPNREIGIGEVMIAFKGRSLMKQYLPKKPIK